jgi:chromosome segregation ATPase
MSVTLVETEDDTMLRHIEELLGDEEPTLARLEDTLTEGYAQALALEAERWRLERRLGEVAREGSADLGEELRSLGSRLTRADGELAELRTLLGTLHERARLVRARG